MVQPELSDITGGVQIVTTALATAKHMHCV